MGRVTGNSQLILEMAEIVSQSISWRVVHGTHRQRESCIDWTRKQIAGTPVQYCYVCKATQDSATHALSQYCNVFLSGSFHSKCCNYFSSSSYFHRNANKIVFYSSETSKIKTSGSKFAYFSRKKRHSNVSYTHWLPSTSKRNAKPFSVAVAMTCKVTGLTALTLFVFSTYVLSICVMHKCKWKLRHFVLEGCTAAVLVCWNLKYCTVRTVLYCTYGDTGILRAYTFSGYTLSIWMKKLIAFRIIVQRQSLVTKNVYVYPPSGDGWVTLLTNTSFALVLCSGPGRTDLLLLLARGFPGTFGKSFSWFYGLSWVLNERSMTIHCGPIVPIAIYCIDLVTFTHFLFVFWIWCFDFSLIH